MSDFSSENTEQDAVPSTFLSRAIAVYVVRDMLATKMRSRAMVSPKQKFTAHIAYRDYDKRVESKVGWLPHIELLQSSGCNLTLGASKTSSKH
jgi:hypothetical protein